MGWLATAALLCQIGGGSNHKSNTANFQLKCQKYYVKCVRAKKSSFKPPLEALSQCVLDRKKL